MAKQNINQLIDKALDNRYTEVGTVAAKYVETLQRSNEQLVKLAALVHKKDSNRGVDSFSEGDKEQLFDLIQKAN